MPIALNTVLGDLSTIPSESEESEEEAEEMETEAPSSEDEPEENYSPMKTFVKKIKYRDGRKIKYKLIFDLNLMPHFGPSFELPATVQPLPLSMIEIYYPDSLLKQWQEATNAYAANPLAPSQRKNLKVQDILRFLATLAYMGICKLAVKEDYFPGNQSDMLPQHTAIHLSKSMFDYLWRNFHVSFAPNDEEFLEQEPTVPEEEIQEEVIIELINNMMLEDMDMDIDNEEEKQQETQQEEDEQQAPQAPPHQAWYSTITPFIDHVNCVSQKLCKHPGWQVAIDKMLCKFKEKSAETFRMKKPDKEGFKFLALCCTITGFIYNFIPDGRLNKEKNKILKAVKYLLSTLPRRHSLKYLLGMDNYFTQPVVVATTRRLNDGLVGTARRQRGWPPQEFKDVIDWRYNSLYKIPCEKDDQSTC
jgi:hypothetical protein